MSILFFAKFGGVCMGLYENIKQVAKAKGYSINKLEQELGFARSYIGKFKTITPSAEKIQQIADFLGVSTDYLLAGSSNAKGVTTCIDCGFTYDSSFPEDIKQHEKEHMAWEKATKKFGKLYFYYPERERIKAENRNICHNLSNPLEERINAQLLVLKCLFSRSVEANGCNLNHVPFDTYISMMLGNKTYRKNLDDALYNELLKKYGTKSGISHGSIYYVPANIQKLPNTIAAHLDISDLSEKEQEDIADYVEYIRSKHKKGD